MDNIRNVYTRGGKVWRENKRGKTEMVWTPKEEIWWVGSILGKGCGG